MQDVIRSVAFFFWFATIKKAYQRKYGKIGIAHNLALGYLSAVLNLFFTMPVEVVNTRLITGASSGSALRVVRELVSVSSDQNKNTALHNRLTQRQIWFLQLAVGGVAQLYTGLRANFILCLNPAIKHMVFDQVPSALIYPKCIKHDFSGVVYHAIRPNRHRRLLAQLRAGTSSHGPNRR